MGIILSRQKLKKRKNREAVLSKAKEFYGLLGAFDFERHIHFVF